MTNPNVQAPSNEGETSLAKRAGAVGVAVLVAVGGLVGINAMNHESKTPIAGADETDDKNSDVANLFKIDTVTADCIEIATESGTATVNMTLKRVLPEVGALKPVDEAGGQENRLWADALSNPLTTGPEKESLETEIKASLCEDALFAVTVANFFANMEVDGVNIGELNKEWLGEYAGDQDAINDKAAEFIPLLDHENDDVSDKEAKAALVANAKHQDLAEHLATMLDRLRNEGVNVEETALNYHLAGAGMKVGGLPEVELNGVQYTGEMLLYVGEAKDGRCLVRIGFNIKDQRPVVTKEVCAVPATTTIPGSPSKPKVPGRRNVPTTNTTVRTTLPDKDQTRDYNHNTDPNNGKGSGGTLGPEGTTSTTAAPRPNPEAPTTSTTMAGENNGTTTTTRPTEPYNG